MLTDFVLLFQSGKFHLGIFLCKLKNLESCDGTKPHEIYDK